MFDGVYKANLADELKKYEVDFLRVSAQCWEIKYLAIRQVMVVAIFVSLILGFFIGLAVKWWAP